MIRKMAWALGALPLLWVSTSALAEVYRHPDAKVQLTMPDTWQVEEDTDSIVATSPDETAVLAFLVLTARQLDRAVKELDKELSKIVTGARFEKEEEVTINGMKGYLVDGTGKVDGTPVDVGVAIVVTKANRLVLVMGFGERGKYEKHERTISGVMQSLKPL